VLQRIKNRRIDDEGGFTLIELLVVIIILGILAAVVVFAVGGIGDKGQGSACRIDTRTLRTAEEAYAGSPQSAGKYGTMATLQSGGFLSDVSTLHDVKLNATSTSFEIITKADKDNGTKSSCTLPTGGAAGVVVNGTAAI